MALAVVGGYGVAFPSLPTSWSGAPSLTSAVIDAAGEKYALVCAAGKAGAIRTIHIRTVTVTTGDTVDVRVETVDAAANGDPTGTLWATNTNGALVIGGGDDSVWKSVALTADATVALGDVFAIVVANGGGGGNIQIAIFNDNSAGFPYGDLFTSSWAKSALSPLILPQYSDGSFGPIYGLQDQGGPINTNTFKSDDATNRRGNIFQVPGPCRASGAWAWVDADGDYTIKLYGSDGTTVLATTAEINRFQRPATTGAPACYPFLTAATLAPGTNYRLAVVPSATTNLSTYDFDVPTAAMLDMYSGGQACHASVFTSSAWVETTTRRGYMGVFLDAVDDGAGSGGFKTF